MAALGKNIDEDIGEPINYLGATARASLEAMIDALLPALDNDEVKQVLSQSPASANVPDAALRLLRKSGSEVGVARAVEEAMAKDILSWEEKAGFRLVLNLLGTRLGTAALCGANPFAPAFSARPRKEREELLRGLSTGSLPDQRKAFNGIKRLVLSLALTFEPASRKGADNPHWAAIDYKPILKKEGKAEKRPWSDVDYMQHMLDTAGLDGGAEVKCDVDVIIVGSGAGGGVAAAQLSEAGFRVLVLEKGEFIKPADHTTTEKDGFERMYEKSALLTTSDQSLSILAGSTLGGGTTVNWGCCIPPPPHVLREWAAAPHGLTQFAPSQAAANDPTAGSTEFEASLAAIWRRIGASAADVHHNRNNQILLDGCSALGLAGVTKVAAQNYKDTKAASAGWSCVGDRDGNKQGTLVTFLADAAKTGCCKFIDQCTVEKVTFAEGNKDRPRATGVVARIYAAGAPGSIKSYRTVTIKARRAVVVSAGSLHTPCVLLRSGLGRHNGHIGKHLHLHPVTGVVAKFPGEDVKIYQGAPMTTVSHVDTMGPKNDGYGAKLEVPSTHPGLMAACLPWRSGVDAKTNLLEINSSAAMIVLQRDRGSGTVELANSGWRYRWLPGADPMSPPNIHYSIHRDDQQSMIESIVTASRVFLAAGAASIMTLHAGAYGIEMTAKPPATKKVGSGKVAAMAVGDKSTPGAEDDPAFAQYADKIRRVGMPLHGIGLFSAHQMGSCRMGADSELSVVDCDGECWDCDDLYVCDASTFPTASGANPMTTTLAIAHLIATRLKMRLEEEDKSLTTNRGATLLYERTQRREAAALRAKRKTIMKTCVASAGVALFLAISIGKWRGDA